MLGMDLSTEVMALVGIPSDHSGHPDMNKGSLNQWMKNEEPK